MPPGVDGGVGSGTVGEAGAGVALSPSSAPLVPFEPDAPFFWSGFSFAEIRVV
jgi:hypothetical protein